MRRHAPESPEKLMAGIPGAEPEGSLTVFYAAIFTTVIAFLLALLSFGRVMIMKTGVRRDLDLCALGVMGEYQKEWAEDFGLYMIPADTLTGSFNYYLEKNSVHMYGDYSCGDLITTAEKTLQDEDELEDQILAFMEERGWLTLADEMTDLLSEAKQSASEAQAVQEETGGLEGTQALADIQSLYASLITDMEGLRNDGSRNLYCVNGLLKEDPSLEEIRTILEKMNSEAGTMDLSSETAVFQSVSSHELGELERALEWLREAQDLCLSAQEKMIELADMARELEQDDDMSSVLSMIPFSSGEMEQYAEVMEDNREYCGDAEGALENLIAMLDDPPESAETVDREIRAFRDIENYKADISLPYDYKESTSGFSFSDLLHRLQGYPDGLSSMASDEELDLDLEKLYGEETEAFYQLDSLTLGESFADTYLTTEYCLGFFRNFYETIEETNQKITPEDLRGNAKKNRFLKNEVEYLIVGKDSEYKNVNGTRQRILTMRTALNMAYLLSNTEKREEIEALAASTGGILLPGVGDAVAFAAILSSWSLAESIQDYSRLTCGGKVPLLKDDSSWQTDLSGLIENLPEAAEAGSEQILEDDAGSGLDYGGYLRILLYLLPREDRLRRIQELLYLDHNRFSLTEAVTEFRVYGTADGIASLTFETSYGFYD